MKEIGILIIPQGLVNADKAGRCTRSCFQCPICIAPLSVSSVEAPPEGLGAEHAQQSGPYVLNCAYCMWSSKEIGIHFEKPNGIYAQLAKINNGGAAIITPKERRKDREERSRDAAVPVVFEDGIPEEGEDVVNLDPNETLDAESHFSNLKAFYQSQLAEASPASALGFTGGDYGYGSPGALSRIMGLYTGGSFADKRSKSKTATMREAQDALEGLQLTNATSEDGTINKLRSTGFEDTASISQLKEQTHPARKHFVDDLRPIAYLLRTKRSKRCKTCRHILSKPESKVQTTRFRIRLVAPSYVPSISIRPLTSSQNSLLTPFKPTQFLLTFKNPLFDRVKISIATPGTTPGRFESRVTVLCPQFEVGANTDAWEEALREGAEREKRRTKAEASEGQLQAEAGKVWERGRNWTSVVVEVVPASLKVFEGPEFLKKKGENGAPKKDEGPVKEDEDVVEIPVFVRVEWETEGQGDDAVVGRGDKELKEKRELAYWCVLGVGRIAHV